MNKQVLTLGIVLTFVTTACTGLGVQTSPTLASQISEDEGLGNLWTVASDQAPDKAMGIEYRDDREFADLWIQGEGDFDRNDDHSEEAPRATAMLERLTVTHSVVNLDSDRSEVLTK